MTVHFTGFTDSKCGVRKREVKKSRNFELSKWVDGAGGMTGLGGDALHTSMGGQTPGW